MGNFINEKSFIQFFRSSGDFAVINMGYDDFSFVKASYSFYKQHFYTWHFIISGCGQLEINGKTYELSGGDTFFISPDTQMRYFPDPNDPWEYVWFAMRGAADYGKQLGFSIDAPTLPCRQFEKTKSILRRTVGGVREKSCGYFGVLAAFYELMDIATLAASPRTEIQAVRDIIDENYTVSDFSVEKLCRDAGYSHAQLLRLFKREYGKTVWSYVVEKRLSLACELLESSELSVRSVAHSCGFSDEIHFIKTFRSRIGVTATEYRDRFKV